MLAQAMSLGYQNSRRDDEANEVVARRDEHARVQKGAAPVIIPWALRSLRRHRDLLSQMVLTDLRGRYAGSTLGLFWSVVHPLVMIAIYLLIFSRIMGARLQNDPHPYAYGVYLCSGLLPWIAFQEIALRCTTLFPDHANLVRKVAFPKAILYGFVALSSAVSFAMALAVFVLALLLSGQPLPWTMVLWLPFVALQLAFGLGLGIVTSVIHVFVRDTAQLVVVLLQVWFWATPIVYVETILPSWLQRAEALNPLYLFCSAHHDLVLHGLVPSLERSLYLAALTIVTLAIGVGLYRRFRADLLDEL